MNKNRRNLILGAGAWAAGAGVAAAQTAPATEFQVLGPFYPLERGGEHDLDLTRLRGHSQRATGQIVELTCRVLTTAGAPVPGARIEVWQANAVGRYAHPSDLNPAPLDPNFQGYARFRADREGRFRVVTVKPGAYAVPGTPLTRTPHVHFDIAGRYDRLATQMYFPEEALNESDILANQSQNFQSLLARQAEAEEAGALALAWDIVLPTG